MSVVCLVVRGVDGHLRLVDNCLAERNERAAKNQWDPCVPHSPSRARDFLVAVERNLSR